MIVNLDDHLPFVHDASGKCDACTHPLHYIPPTPETFWPWSLSNKWVDYVEEPMKYQALSPHFFSVVGWGWGVGGGVVVGRWVVDWWYGEGGGVRM